MKKLLLILFVLISVAGFGQATYNPAQPPGMFFTINKPLGQSRNVALDARTMKADTINFLYRPYAGTAEVLTYLNTTNARTGWFPIIVNIGGALQSNGTFIGGTLQPYWFLRGTADANLVRMYTDSTTITLNGNSIFANTSGSPNSGTSVGINAPLIFTGNNLAVDTSNGLTKVATQAFVLSQGFIKLNSLSVTTVGTSGPATYNNTTGVINIPNYTNNPPLNPTAGYGIKITGSNPNFTWSIDSANYRKLDSVYRIPGQDSTWFVLNGRTFPIKDSVSAIPAGITQLTGQVLAGPGSGTQTATLATNTVLYGQIQQVNANSLMGNPNGSTQNVTNVGLLPPLIFSGTNVAADTSAGATKLATQGYVNNQGFARLNSFSMTNTGVQGLATYNGTTGQFNVPNYGGDSIGLTGFTTNYQNSLNVNAATAPLSITSRNISISYNNRGFNVTSNVLVNRSPVFNSSSDIRANALPDTTIIQNLTFNKVTQPYKYDPNDITSVDDSVTVIVNGSGQRFKAVFTDSKINVRLFGAVGDGSTDDYPAIQKAINTIVGHSNLPKTLFFPQGNYSITQPLIVYSWNGSDYQFCQINLEGQESAQFNNTQPEAIIRPTFKNTFAIGFQNARSCVVKGLCIIGQFSPANGASNWYNYYNRPFATWVSSQDATIRDSQYSPYAGIVFEPFRNTNTLPPDGGYPGLSSYYRGTGVGTNSGTSAVTIEECRIFGFTVDIIMSPNGQTSNAEDIIVKKCALEVAKVAYASCQQQSKDNFIRNAISWDRVHTLVDNSTYGLQQGQPPYIDGWNVAGDIIQICNVQSIIFQSSFNNIFAESIYRLGNVSGVVAFNNCEFDFNIVPSPILIPPSHISGTTGQPSSGGSVSFKTCVFKYYDNTYSRRMIVMGSGYAFDNCAFDDVPLALETYALEAYKGLTFSNCATGSGKVIGWPSYKGYFTTSNPQIVAYGKVTVEEGGPLTANSVGWLRGLKQQFDCGNANKSLLIGAVSVTIDTVNRTGTLTIPAPYSTTVAIGDYITTNTSNFQVIGKIATINRGTGAATLVNVPMGTYTGTFTIFSQYYDQIGGAFVGDLTNGSASIQNVVTANSLTMGTPYVGQRLKIGYPFFTPPVIDSIVGNRIVMSVASNYTQAQATNPYFSKDYTADKTTFLSPELPTLPHAPSQLTGLNFLITEGSRWIVPHNQYGVGTRDESFICIKSGFLSPASVGQTLQAVWINEWDVARYGSTAAADGGLQRIYYDTVLNQIMVKDGSTWHATGGAVSSVANSDGTLTISPTTGNVIGSLNLGHANTWTAVQTFNNPPVLNNILSGAGTALVHATDSTIKQINLSAASFTSTLTNTTNISSSTFNIAYYQRVGNIVHVLISGQLQPTVANTISTLTFTLPFTTTVTTQQYVGGGFINYNAGAAAPGTGTCQIVSGTTGQLNFFSGLSLTSSNFAIQIDYTL